MLFQAAPELWNATVRRLGRCRRASRPAAAAVLLLLKVWLPAVVRRQRQAELGLEAAHVDALVGWTLPAAAASRAADALQVLGLTLRCFRRRPLAGATVESLGRFAALQLRTSCRPESKSGPAIRNYQVV